MKRIALVLFVMCVQICVCVSAHAQSGATCTNPIPFGKNYSATIQGPCSVWYMGNTFDLPLSVKFYPANNSDKAPEIKLDLTCTPGVYEDEIACKLFCHNQSSYIPLPYTMTLTGKTDSEGHVYYELEIGEFYRDQLLRAGISYNIEVYVEVTYFGGGSINVVPDKISQCMDTDKWLLLGVERTVEANDNETYFVAPYANWTNDSVRYVWSGAQPATIAIGTTCDFNPLDASDSHRLEVMEMDAQDTVKHTNAKILNMQSYAFNAANPASGALFYVKAVSDAPGTLKVEHIPAAELKVEAEELVYDQPADIAANDVSTLYAIPKSWTSATRFDTPTDHIFKMYIGVTPEFGVQDAIVMYQFNKNEDGHWFGITEADMSALWQQTTDKYLYVRFECSANTTVTPSAWTVSDCIGTSKPLEKNTTVTVATRSKEKYRIYYNDWKDGDIAFTWNKTSLCKVLISGNCNIGTGNGEGIIAYDELKDGHQSYQLTTAELKDWSSFADADGYIYMRFYTTVSGGGQMTITSTALVIECGTIETTDGATVWEDDLPYTWEGISFTTAGTETKTLQTSDGCDSIVTFTLRVLYRNITLQENEDANYYTQFAQDYNGRTVTTATLNRQFGFGKWATLCLPFNVNKSLMIALGLNGRVYEFRHADLWDDVAQIYFAPAQSIEAGKGYIVNANAKLALKTSFVFPNVTINTDSDTGDITTLTGYNDGTGRGNLFLVGTLRTGLLQGSIDGNTYLGLKNNMLYYPNSTSGTAIRAYRGFFRSTEPMKAHKVRIIVEGEASEELLIDNGELMVGGDALNDMQTTVRKYIRNGILLIERNGKTYTAQGQRLD